MLIKDDVWKVCGECKSRKELVSEAVYGCDQCKKPIEIFGSNGKRHHDYLSMTVFRDTQSSEAEHLHFCSWKCVLKKLPTIKSDYFASLPYLHFEGDTVKGQSAKDLFRLLKKL